MRQIQGTQGLPTMKYTFGMLRQEGKALKRLTKAGMIIMRFLLAFVLSVFLISAGENRYTYAVGSAGSSFQIDFIDVGQGDAALVQCDGHYMLVDGGDSKQSSRIYSFLQSRSIQNLDVLVATHADADHIGGLSGALNYAKVGEAYSPVKEHDSKEFQSLVKYLDAQGVTLTVPKAGDTFKIGSATATVLGPRTISSESNNNSIVLRIVYRNTSFLLMGDAEAEEENSILNSGRTVKSDVLKAAHHGSKYSSGDFLIRKVAPQYAVISVGSDNTYGHPSEDVLGRLRDFGVKTYRTDIQGDITCTSDGKKVSFTVKKNAGADTLAVSGQTAASKSAGVSVGAAANTTDVRNTGADSGQTDASEPRQSETSYVLNTNTRKFHYPSCSSVSKMKEKNKANFTGTRDEAIAQGYDPCKNCNP